MPNHHFEVVRRYLRCPNCGERAEPVNFTYFTYIGVLSGTGKCTNCRQPTVTNERVDLWTIEYDSPRVSTEPFEFNFRYEISANLIQLRRPGMPNVDYRISDGCNCPACRGEERRRGATEPIDPFEGFTEEIVEDFDHIVGDESSSMRRIGGRVTRPRGRVENKRVMYVVLKGEKESAHVVEIYSESIYAQDLLTQGDDMRIVQYPCDSTTDTFIAYVVSVGTGKRYRIIDITDNEKKAAKIATSVRGKISVYEVTPSNRKYRTVNLHKFFVNLDYESDEADRVFHVDIFNRRYPLFEGENVPPIVTHRRRYNESLPHRLEVAASERATAEAIARQLGRLTTEEIKEQFEYNVDYEMIEVDGKWEIKPSLLEAAGLED